MSNAETLRPAERRLECEPHSRRGPLSVGLRFSRRRLAITVLAGLAAWAALTSVAAARGHRSPVPAHIPTWAVDDGCGGGGGGAGASLVRHWVSYAESHCGPTANKAHSDCQGPRRVYCRVMQYLDPNWIYGGDDVMPARAAASNWWLTEPAPRQGASIFTDWLGTGHLINQAIPAVRAFFRSYVRRNYNRDDGLLLDWQSTSLAQELYYSTCHCRRTAQIGSDRSLRAAHTKMSAALTHRNGSRFIQADNSLPPSPFLPQGMRMLNHRIGVDAFTVEGEPMSNGKLMAFYSTLLDQIAYIETRTRGFVVPMSRAPANAPYLAQTRRVQEATMLLGFRPRRLVDWANLEDGSGRLAVWPEEGIYPTSPLESMAAPGGRGCLAGTGVACSRGGHLSVQVAAGIYRREFRSCYRRRIAFGGCAAIMNTTGAYVTVRPAWLRRHYRHRITFAGGDVQSRGTVNLTRARFSVRSAVIPPHDAILLAR
jgi:hypothetical protein